MASDNKVDVQVEVSVTGQQALGALPGQLDQIGEHASQVGQQGQAAGAGLDAAAAAARNAGQAGAQAAAGAQQAAQGMTQTGDAASSARGALDAAATATSAVGQAGAQAAQGLAQEGNAASSAAGQLDQTATAARAVGQAGGQAATSAQQAAQGLQQAGNAASGAGKANEQATAAIKAAEAAFKTKAQAIDAELTLEKSAIEVARQSLNLQATQQQAALASAKAKGDEAAATEAQNRLNQIQAQQLELTAQAQLAQAAAIERVATAKREEYTATGQLTQAQQHALQAENNAAQALRLQAQAALTAASANRQTAQGLKQAGSAADEATGKLAATRRGLQSISTQLAEMQTKLESSFGSLQKRMWGLLGAGGIGTVVKSSIELADAYGQMAERIKMATPIASEYDEVQRRILETANQTYRPLAEQQELYIRTADSLRSLAYTTGEALDITDSFSYLLTTNAASGERAKNAIDAYSKSIQSGKVDAQSWQSMLAATPTLVDAIAKATGKSASEIRQMGVTGNLALRDLNEGLRQSVEANKKAAGEMKATVTDAITRLSNTWQTYLGKTNEATGSTQEIVKVLDLLSNHLDAVVGAAITAGKVMVAVWGVQALVSLQKYTAGLVTAQKETTLLMQTTVAGANKAAQGLAAAGKLAAAAWIGGEIGSYLEKQFLWAKQAGISMAEGLTKAAAYVQGAWEMAKAVFTSDTVEAAQERLRQRLMQISDEYDALRDAAVRAHDEQAQAAEAAAKAAAETQGAAGKWNALSKAVEESSKQTQKYYELLEKTGAARMAEAQTAVQLANAFGDEAQKRRAAADAAQVQAENTRALANVRQSEVTAMESERAAILELGQAYIASNEKAQERLKVLNETIPLRKAEADAASAQAAQSEVVAAQAAVESEKLRDNSARVDELRRAHEKAAAALEKTQAAYKAGKASLEELNKAQVEAAKTAALLADAIDDQRAKLEAKSRAQQAALSLQEMSVRVAMEEWRAIKEVAKARGDEETVMRAQNEIRKLEIELLELQAQAKRAEADAQLAAVAAERAALIASEQLTEQKRLELDAAMKAAEVKQKEAQIAEITANKLRQLAAAEEESGNAADGAADKHHRNAEGIEAEARATDKLTDAQLRARGITRNADGTYTKGGIRVTEDGWAADAHGNAIVMNNELGSLTAIYDRLKSAGVDDDAAARRIALEFSDGKGNVPILGNYGQLKYRKTKYDSLSTAVLYAAEQYTFGLDQGNPVTQKTPPASAPSSASVSAAPTVSVPTASARTVNVNLSLGGQRMGQVQTDDSGAASIEAFMRALENDKRLSGRY